jgi:uncharacterized phosphosugar-binding protein
MQGELSGLNEQKEEMKRAAEWFADSILAGRVVHVFGSGKQPHMVEEIVAHAMVPLPGFNPIVELSSLS